jgi:hypothetical protein
MEDVLAVYTRPRDPGRPVVCLDETSKQLIAETRAPVAMHPGRPARVDYEYARNGVATMFMMFAPLEGWRHVKVTDRRTAVDYAHALKDLADIHFAKAETIVLIQDNLNTHAAASLYEPFPPPRPGAWSNASNGITRPSTAHGWTSLNPNSASSARNVSIGASPTSRRSSTRSPTGSLSETKITPSPNGASQPTTPASNSKAYTRQYD